MINSPCTKQCNLNENDICTGCYRLKYEISIWNKCTDKAKKAIILAVNSRHGKNSRYGN